MVNSICILSLYCCQAFFEHSNIDFLIDYYVFSIVVIMFYVVQIDYPAVIYSSLLLRYIIANPFIATIQNIFPGSAFFFFPIAYISTKNNRFFYLLSYFINYCV